MTDEALAGLVGQAVIFAPLDMSRHVYLLTRYDPVGRVFDAVWPD